MTWFTIIPHNWTIVFWVEVTGGRKEGKGEDGWLVSDKEAAKS